MQRIYLFSLLTFLSLASCRKKDDPVVVNQPHHSGVRISFDNKVGSQQLILNSSNWYINEYGDSFKVSSYKYYISNIVLTREDDSTFVEPNSYHLINEADSTSLIFLLAGVPKGNYKKISFLVGVDPERNTSGAQTGALDPSHGMFWDWNTGYIMSKMEGTSPSSPVGFFSYHLGGFSGESSVLRYVTLDLPGGVAVTAPSVPNIHIKADALEWFKTPHLISINDLFAIGGKGPDATNLATNYADMFSVDHIE